MSKALEFSGKLKELINGIQESTEIVCNDIKRLDRKTSDLLHEIELKDYKDDERKRLELFDELKKVRTERRDSKKEQETFIILNDYIDNFCGMLKIGIDQLEGQIKYKESGQVERFYIPRVDGMWWE